MTIETLLELPSIISIVLFILALRGLSSPTTSKKGNILATIGMAISVLVPLCLYFNPDIRFLITVLALSFGGIIGYIVAKKIDMAALPQLIAAFHSLVGLSAVFIACSVFSAPNSFGVFDAVARQIPISNAIETALGAAIGAITFSGSVIAFGKLQGFISGKPLKYKGQNKLNFLLVLSILAAIGFFIFNQIPALFFSIVFASFTLGCLLIIPIGGADMPVIVSMLNSYSGWSAAGIGFALDNNVLIIIGALVGVSGTILSDIMSKGMNRSLRSVVLGGMGTVVLSGSEKNRAAVKICSASDASFIMKNANSVIIVPGYGMAVSQAQLAVKELSDLLKKEEISVKYAIHPVAGRMPGHMNVLLAEANIPYEDVFEIDEINREFGSCDAALVIGANDITNPAAKNDPNSPIYGMPILEVEKAKTVLFIKRSLGSGYAGIDNALFYRNNVTMILGDAKKVVEEIVKFAKE